MVLVLRSHQLFARLYLSPPLCGPLVFPQSLQDGKFTEASQVLYWHQTPPRYRCQGKSRNLVRFQKLPLKDAPVKKNGAGVRWQPLRQDSIRGRLQIGNDTTSMQSWNPRPGPRRMPPWMIFPVRNLDNPIPNKFPYQIYPSWPRAVAAYGAPVRAVVDLAMKGIQTGVPEVAHRSGQT